MICTLLCTFYTYTFNFRLQLLTLSCFADEIRGMSKPPLKDADALDLLLQALENDGYGR